MEIHILSVLCWAKAVLTKAGMREESSLLNLQMSEALDGRTDGATLNQTTTQTHRGHIQNSEMTKADPRRHAGGPSLPHEANRNFLIRDAETGGAWLKRIRQREPGRAGFGSCALMNFYLPCLLKAHFMPLL